ncbi:hypothetical protein H920_01272 [Fukomys damarensis]|uniref:Uncharacterized protein n=1 Tax=Fukomys damarensis TaxID=885580 RepID=A0A091E421_FUKDA|nr:hypothetical protein H920_01272 [Fukomys damarensis]
MKEKAMIKTAKMQGNVMVSAAAARPGRSEEQRAGVSSPERPFPGNNSPGPGECGGHFPPEPTDCARGAETRRHRDPQLGGFVAAVLWACGFVSLDSGCGESPRRCASVRGPNS